MDIVRLASPWVLAVALPVWAAILCAALATRPRRAGAAGRAVLTCLAAGLLVLALAGPSVRVSRQGMCPVCIAEDVSGSMAVGRVGPGPAETLARWAAAVPGGQVGLVPFEGAAGRAIAPGSPEGRRLVRPEGFPSEPLPPSAAGPETSIEIGLLQAAAVLPDGQGIALLYSDGRETAGDAAEAATRLASRGIQVHAVAPDLRPRDAALVSVGPASPPAPGRPVRIQVRIASTVAAQARVVLERDPAGPATEAAPRWERRVALDPASPATILFADEAPPDGVARYRARVEMDGDECPENNAARCAVGMGRHVQVIYVHGGKGPGPLLDLVRRQAPAGAEVRAAAADAGLEADATGASIIVLDNVSAWGLGRDAAGRLARLVTDGGAGLLALGGDASFAAGGYADSPLEDVLPVTSRTAERPPVEMVVVVDSSGSMNEKVGELQKLALAKQAVLALRPALASADRLGIVAFAGEARTVSPLVSLEAWEDLRSRLLAMQAGGGTRITGAVEAAAGLFSDPVEGGKTVRHILLLSDGRSADFDVDRLVALCRRRLLSVSAVATGTDADRDRLAQLASLTGGRLHDAADLGRLAETFLKDLAMARGEGLREEARPAAWARPEPIWSAASVAGPAAGPPLPPVAAHNTTRPKEGADVHWVTRPQEAGEEPAPLLASWRRGLGKAAAMPWPVGAAGEAWLSDDAARRRLAPVLAWLSAATVPTDWSARLVERGSEWWVCVEERGEAIGRRPAPFVAAVVAEAGDAAPNLVLAQTAPGIHEGRIGSRGTGGATVVVHRQDTPQEMVHLSMPGAGPREFQHLGVDRGRLEAVARAGGGEVLASPERLAEAVRRMQVRGFEPAAAYLVWATAAAVAIQAALRLLGRL